MRLAPRSSTGPDMSASARPSIVPTGWTSRRARGEEGFVDLGQRGHRHVLLMDRKVELEQQLAGDAGEAARRERRRQQSSADADEHVRARALAEVADRVGEQCLLGAERARVLAVPRRSRRTRSSSDRPARLRSLRGHGTVTTSAAVAHAVAGPHWMTTVAGASPRADPSGAAPPVTVTRTHPAPGWLATIVVSIASRSTSSVERHDEPETLRRAMESRQVAPDRERGVVDDLHRLEHPVADREPMIGDRHRRLVRRHQRAVDPDLHRHDHGLPAGNA